MSTAAQAVAKETFEYDVCISYSSKDRAWVRGELQHAREARQLATCDGPPDLTYKVAYEEAGVLLKQLTKDE